MTKKIILDMDGVLVDFNGPAHELLEIPIDPWPWPTGQYILPIYDSDFFDNLTVEWWDQRQWLSFSKELLNICTALVGLENIWIATTLAPTDSRTDVLGKMLWMKRELPDLKNRIIFCWDKSILASSETVLLDDYFENITTFRKAGGSGVLVPRMHNFMSRADPIVHCRRTLLKLIH